MKVTIEGTEYDVAEDTRAVIVDANGDLLQWNLEFRQGTSDWKPRTKYIDRLTQHGGKQTSDRRSSARDIKVGFEMGEESPTNYREVLNTLVAYFRPNKSPFYLYDIQENIRGRVEFQGVKISEEKGTERVYSVCAISLKLEEALWEDFSERIFDDDGSEGSNIGHAGGLWVQTGDQFTINLGGFERAYPFYEFYSNVQNPDFLLENDAIGGGFRIENFGFGASSQGGYDKFTVNTKTGELLLNGAEAGSSLTQGGMIWLEPGPNTFLYIGDQPVLVRIRYRATYMF